MSLLPLPQIVADGAEGKTSGAGHKFAPPSRKRGHFSAAKRQRINDFITIFSQELSAFERQAAKESQAASDGTECLVDEMDHLVPDVGEPLLVEPQVDLKNVAKGPPPQKTGVIGAMVHDYIVMKQNMRDYDVALCAAEFEAKRLHSEVVELDRLCDQVRELQELLTSQQCMHNELRLENARLASANNKLTLIIHDALDATGDVELDGWVDRLMAENEMLWKLARISRSASINTNETTQASTPVARTWLSSPVSGRTRSLSSSTPSSSAASQLSPIDMQTTVGRSSSPESTAAADVAPAGSACEVSITASRNQALSTGGTLEGSGSIIGALNSGLEASLEDDDMSEDPDVSSLVENVIFVGGEAQEAASDQ